MDYTHQRLQTIRLYTSLIALLMSVLIADPTYAGNLLQALDTSSPRATMESFIANTEATARRYIEYRDSPSQQTYDALIQTVAKSWRLFDLSQIPPTARREVGAETRLLLWEVIARVELPDMSEIPDVAAVKERDEQGEPLALWRLPGTEITIARVEKGPRAGEFLFSPDTVERAQSFYEMARGLPYRHSLPIGDLVRVGQLFTGWMIPPAWVESLPGWANTPVLGQVLWKWFALLLLFGVASGVVFAIFRWGRRKPWDGSLGSYLRYLSAPLAILALSPVLQFLVRRQINVTGSAAQAPDYLIEVASGLALIWLVWLTISWIAEAIIASPKVSAKSLDAHLIRLVARSVGIAVILAFVFRVFFNLGFPVYALVAGGGVGGLAIALAARSTLENFMGTLNIYADRPVRGGDFCRYGEDVSPDWMRVGTVEEIGLRSTRIRGIDRTITTIPNAEFANMHIVNLTKRDRIAFRTTLALRAETTPNQLRVVRARVRELLLAHPRVANDPARVHFAGFGEYSMNVEILAYVNTSDWDEFLSIREDLHFRILDIVGEVGTAFAFPSRLYHTRDGGLDGDRQQAAEKQVRDWAAAQTLPFPDFPEEYRKQIRDTLDYPPDGSPGADRS